MKPPLAWVIHDLELRLNSSHLAVARDAPFLAGEVLLQFSAPKRAGCTAVYGWLPVRRELEFRGDNLNEWLNPRKYA